MKQLLEKSGLLPFRNRKIDYVENLLRLNMDSCEVFKQNF